MIDFRGILDSVPSLIQCVSPEGKLLYANAAWLETLGYPVEEMESLTIVDFVAEESLGHCKRVFERLLAGEKPGPVHAVFRTKAGVLLSVEGALECFFHEGEPRYTRGIFTVVDDTRRLVRLHERFFNVSPDLLCVADFEGRFRLMNPSWERVLGYRIEELEGQPFLDFVHQNDVEATVEQSALLARGEASVSFQNRYRHKDGSYRWVRWNAASDVDTRLILASARDVTEELAQSEKLRRAIEEAEAASIAKSSFLANMSHELRTPLNSVIGFSELLFDQAFGALNPKQSRYVENVLSNGRLLLALINDILDLSKVEAGEMTFLTEVLDLRHSVIESLEQIRPLANAKKQSFKFASAEGAYLAFADRQRTRQVLLNLLSNAVKFTPNEGEIEVSLSSELHEWRVSISDNGRGLDPRHVDTIFERFQQLDAAITKTESGTGLGLALCRQFVERQKGRIWAESDGEGLGAIFHFTLCKAELGQEILSSGHALVNNKPLVLIVEDDSESGQPLTTHLASSGYRIARAVTGRKALNLVETLSPSGIVLDLELYDRNGWEVLKQLKSNPISRGIPVIISSSDGSRVQTVALQASGMVDKPVLREDFLRVLKRGIPDGHLHKVLVIDVDPSFVEILGDWLTSEGLEVHEAQGVEAGVALALKIEPHVLVIDLDMSEVDGMETIERLRVCEPTAHLPIVVLTTASISAKQKERVERLIQGFVLRTEKQSLVEVLGNQLER